MVEEQSLSEKTYELLKREVLSCALAPGTFVTENDLADRYRVSKTPVREAVSRLAQEGFIQSVPRRGTLIKPIAVRDVQQTYFLRGLLEPAAAELAAQRRTETKLVQLKKLLDEMHGGQLPDGRLNPIQIQRHREFHVALAEASEIPRLATMINALHEQVEQFMNANAHLGAVLTFGSWDQEMLVAIGEGNSEEARDIATRAVATSRQQLIETILGVS